MSTTLVVLKPDYASKLLKPMREIIKTSGDITYFLCKGVVYEYPYLGVMIPEPQASCWIPIEWVEQYAVSSHQIEGFCTEAE